LTFLPTRSALVLRDLPQARQAKLTGDTALRHLEEYSWPGNVRRLRSVLETGGNKAQAARLLGIHRDTLPGKLRKYGIEEESG